MTDDATPCDRTVTSSLASHNDSMDYEQMSREDCIRPGVARATMRPRIPISYATFFFDAGCRIFRCNVGVGREAQLVGPTAVGPTGVVPRAPSENILAASGFPEECPRQHTRSADHTLALA